MLKVILKGTDSCQGSCDHLCSCDCGIRESSVKGELHKHSCIAGTIKNFDALYALYAS
jgi:hypothetical protein